MKVNDTVERRPKLLLLPGWPFEMACVAVAAALLAFLIASGSRLPGIESLVLFAVTLVLAANAAVLMPSMTGVSPCFMFVLASIAAFGSHGAVLGAALVGVGGGVTLRPFKNGRYTAALFDCAQYLLASAAAAAVFVGLNGSGDALGFAGAVAAFAVVNTTLVVAQISLNLRERPATVLADVRTILPNYLAFGALGVLVGELYLSLGAITLPLLIIPAAVARRAFASFQELRAAHEATVKVFIRTIEAKDPYTAGHTERVANYAMYIGQELKLSQGDLEHLRHAALLHDVGKLAVPKSILNKPGKLTSEEYAIVQRHNQVCIDILTRVDFMRSLVATASDRHAHYDRSEQREQRRLVQEAHIVAIADAFDAMTSTRSYRKALSQEVAFAELRDKSGTQFNPELVEALIRAIERRSETYGLGHEESPEQFEVEPPLAGVGSAGLGDLLPSEQAVPTEAVS